MKMKADEDEDEECDEDEVMKKDENFRENAAY
jgi:hypothetical protein